MLENWIPTRYSKRFEMVKINTPGCPGGWLFFFFFFFFKAVHTANMKISIVSTILSAALATASPHFGVASLDNWKPAGHGDCTSFHTLYIWNEMS